MEVVALVDERGNPRSRADPRRETSRDENLARPACCRGELRPAARTFSRPISISSPLSALMPPSFRRTNRSPHNLDITNQAVTKYVTPIEVKTPTMNQYSNATFNTIGTCRIESYNQNTMRRVRILAPRLPFDRLAGVQPLMTLHHQHLEKPAPAARQRLEFDLPRRARSGQDQTSSARE
jgi:hypothetical protein